MPDTTRTRVPKTASPAEVLARLGLDGAALAELCAANGVRRLAIFGSASREDFDPGRSDLDVLVKLEAATSAEYAERYFRLREELARLTGRRVDLMTEASLTNPYLERRIAAERISLYAA